MLILLNSLFRISVSLLTLSIFFTKVLQSGMMLTFVLSIKITMTPQDLRAHKNAPKKLQTIPVFKPQARKKLPKPFNNLGGPRIQSTGMIDVSDTHVAFMYWRDGEILTDRSFFGYLFCRMANGRLSPIFEFHWHPSHKGFHCKTPCRTVSDFTDRTLPGAPELSLNTDYKCDPKEVTARSKLVFVFCRWCGISLPNKDVNSATLDL